MRFIFLLLFVFLNMVNGFSQTDSLREEFILNAKIYKPYSNYLTIAPGLSYNILSGTPEQALEINYCFRIKTYFFETGYLVSSDKFVLYRSLQKLNSLYFVSGYRKESVHKNIGLFAGINYVYGSYFIGLNSHNRPMYHGLTHHFGLLIKAEYTVKLFYDIGIGVGLFGNWNQEYPIAGLNIHLYFSGAYRGTVNPK